MPGNSSQQQVKDTVQSLKMPDKPGGPVARGKKAAALEERTLQSVMRDAVWLFITGKLTPDERVPRTPYGSGGGPGRAVTPASVKLSALEWQLFRAAQDRWEHETGIRYTVSDVCWTYLTRSFVPEDAPEEHPLAWRARLKAEQEKRKMASVMRDAVLTFVIGDLEPAPVPEDENWKLPAEPHLSVVESDLLAEAQHKAQQSLGFSPALSDIVYSYLDLVYVPLT